MNKGINFHYSSETADKYNVTGILNCYNSALANGIKSKFGNEIDIYTIFAENIQVLLKTDGKMNIDFLSVPRFPNQYIKPIVYKNANLEMLEKFLDEDKIIIINTLHHEIKFFVYYNTPYDYLNGMPVHWTTVIHHDDKNIYYVENLDLINKKNYKYYNDNKFVGVVEKSYMNPFFDKYLVCVTIDIDFDRLDLFIERLFVILNSYVESAEKEETINGYNYFYGITALKKMIELCSVNNDLNKKKDYDNEKLIDGVRYIFRMRIYMKECLLKLTENKSFITHKEILDIFEPSIESLITLTNILMKRDMKKQPLLDNNLIKYFNNIIKYEENLIDFISKLLQYETIFLS